MFQQVLIIGRLGQDPQMRYTPNGHAVTNFSVAANRTYTNGAGEQVQTTEWFRVVAWRKLAEVCNQYLAKGRLVAVVGRLQTRSWQDEESGEARYATELVASTVKFLDRGDNGGTSAGEDGEEFPDLGDDEELPF